MSTKKTVELFYDVISPYSWIAFEFLCRAKNKWNIDLKLKPMFLGAIMKESGNRPPMTVPSKGAYMVNDLHRLRELYKIPLNHPPDVADVLLNKGSLSAQRLLTYINMNQPEITEKLSRELWMRVWSRGEDITLTESFLEALKKVGIPDSSAKDFVQNVKDKGIANRLKEVTQEALDHGAFGAPTIVATDALNNKHMIWGSDRMEILAHILGEKYEGPFTQYAASKL